MLTFVLFAVIVVLLYIVVRQRILIIGLRKQQTRMVYLIEAAKTYGRYASTNYFHEYIKWIDSAPYFSDEWHRFEAMAKRTHAALSKSAGKDYDNDAIVREWYDSMKQSPIPATNKTVEVENG